MVIEKNIPIEMTANGEDHLCLSLTYRNADGYYLCCYPVRTIKCFDYRTGQKNPYNKISNNGLKLLVRKADRKSTEDEEKAISKVILVPSYFSCIFSKASFI